MWYAREERHHDPIFDDAEARPRAPDTNERAQAGALAPRVVRGAARPLTLSITEYLLRLFPQMESKFSVLSECTGLELERPI